MLDRKGILDAELPEGADLRKAAWGLSWNWSPVFLGAVWACYRRLPHAWIWVAMLCVALAFGDKLFELGIGQLVKSGLSVTYFLTILFGNGILLSRLAQNADSDPSKQAPDMAQALWALAALVVSGAVATYRSYY